MADESGSSDGATGSLVEVSVTADQFLDKLTGGALEGLGGLAADWLRHMRLKLLAGRLEGAKEMCREAGIENPAEVSLSTLAPWIKGASIEDDPDLHSMWESLLANAADPRDGGDSTHRSFVRILRQVEAPELRVLKALYHIDAGSDRKIAGGGYPRDEDIRETMTRMGLDPPPDEQLQLAKIILNRPGLCSRGGHMISGVSIGISTGGENPP